MSARTTTAGHGEEKVDVGPPSDSARNQRSTILSGHKRQAAEWHNAEVA